MRSTPQVATPNLASATLAAMLLLALPALGAAPTATTNSATSITATTAVLNGTTNPGGEATTGWFRHSTTNPGTCDDAFGSRVPASGGTAVGSGSVAVAYSVSTTGLAPGTTYYYCAIVSNTSGTAFGSILSFTTPSLPPTVFTAAATIVTSSSAILNGSGTPNGASTTGFYRYSTSSPGSCSNSFGTRAPSSGGTDLGSGSASQNFSETITGLLPGTTYYYCALATNVAGTSYGVVLSFTTLVRAPDVVTSPAYNISSTSATLAGTATPNGDSTTAWFRISSSNPVTCNDAFGSRVPASGGSNMGSGTSASSYTQGASGLSPGTTYYYCAIASNSQGTSTGSVLTFSTPALPVVTTLAESLLTATSATLNGTAAPNGSSATGYFRYSSTNPGVCDDVFGNRAPYSGGTSLGSGSASVAFNSAISSLLPGTTYYFCAIAINGVGTSFGGVSSFTTPPAVPIVSTHSASSVSGTAATFNGSATPRGAAATGWFRYSATNPGTCDDTFGTRAPASGGTALGTSSSTSQNFLQAVTGLAWGTTYYFCAIASNSVGTSFGAVSSFTTTHLPVVVVTNAATAILPTSATLNGTGTPNNSPAQGWFRYSTTNPTACDDAFGWRTPWSSGISLGSGSTPQSFSSPVTLTPGTTYYFCAIASNVVGTVFGSVLTFTAPPTVPAVTTLTATSVTGTTATIRGQANPGGASSTGYFRYSSTSPITCNDTFGTRAPSTAGTSLGTGNSDVSYTEPLTGLTPGTTYYYCAIASNSEGTGLGQIYSFATPAAPTVVTNAVSSISGTAAYANGTGTPNGASATGWFRYSLSDPGTCNDTFGTRAPLTSGTSLGSGSSGVSYGATLSPLSPGSTYYVCAIASNTVGTSFGSVVSFSTPAAPAVTTLPADSVTSTSGTLNASGIPNGNASTGWFRYSSTNPTTCNDTFGIRAPASGGTALGSGSGAAPFSVTPTGLLPGTTYYFCAIASNTVGTSYGSVLSFTTPAMAPLVTSVNATAISNVAATLNGSATARGDATSGWFRYATTNPGACDDTFGTRAPTTGGTSVGSGNTATAFSQNLTGLLPSTTYFWCAIASNSVGTTYGTIISFTTVAVPAVTTAAASPVTSTTATLNASAIPNGTSATGWFRYSTTNPGACDDTFGIRTPASGGTALGSGMIDVPYSQALSGLLPGTAYYFCAIASNSVGTGLGSVLSFTTPPMSPAVITVAATSVGSTTATLNGTANPNGATSAGWLRYAASNPGVCNDAFGTRVPTTGSTALPAGNTALPYSENITGLTAGTTYYFCALASNSVGLSYGAVLTLTTTSTPVASSVVATSITSTSVTLNGAANPNRDSTTGYFRYATTSPGTCNDTFGTRAPATGGSPLASGSTAVSYSQNVTGLLAGTQYYYCALATNSVGTGVGTVLTFTTLNAPTVVTAPVTMITGSSATLNATANPNNAATTGWFRYSLTDPVTCSDTFGYRTPSSGGTALGAGSAAVAYTASLSGLASGTTYYVCAIASNNAGVSFGAPATFTTLGSPTVTTLAATLVTNNSATLNASSNPNGAPTTGYFRYSTTNPFTCNDTFGIRAPATGGTSLGGGTAVANFSENLTGLQPASTYYYCVIAWNSVGTRYGAILSFTTTSGPTVVSSAPTAVTEVSAVLNGSVNPRGLFTTGWFRYSSVSPGSTCNDTFGTRAPASGGISLGSGTTSVALSEPLTGLTRGTRYYFCAIASNQVGTEYGAVLSFATLGPPVVTTSPATSVAGSTAVLNGEAVPNGTASTGYFRYSTVDPGTCNDTFGTRAPATGGTSLGSGSSPVTYSQSLSGLSSSTTYYYCAIASSSVATAVGVVASFTTAAAPAVTSVAASSITSSSAALNASASPNGSSATGWFRYSTINPVTCNDTFGTRMPFSGGTSLGSGTTAVNYSQTLTGLYSGTTYYYCAIASNVAGTGVGQVLSFSTQGAPSVSTQTATQVSSSVATLNGTAEPRGVTTTGFFRYSTVNPGSCNSSFGFRAPSTGGATLGPTGGPTPFTQGLTGLSPATTYYFCAIATNSWGTAFGAVLSFTTPTGPTVVSAAATSVSGIGATLNGSGSPAGLATSGYFRYSTTSPTSCNDTFGTRTADVSLGSGTTGVPYSTALSGLTPGSTYYYCALASNSSGVGLGSLMSFFTPAPPVAVTTSATNVTSTTATLTGTVNPNGATATAWMRYATTSPGACDDTFGTRLPLSGGTPMGSGSTAMAFSLSASGLMPGTTYYYCAIASSSEGTSFGTVMSTTTLALPVATTSAATGLTASGATLNGSGVPNGASATGWFRYATTSPGTCSDSFGVRAPTAGGPALGSGSAPTPFTQSITGLAPATTYYFCAIVQSTVGTGLGAVLSFTTPAAPPAVSTVAASSVGAAQATLNGTATPNGSATVAYFRYGTANPGTCSDTFGTRAPSSGGTALTANAPATPFTEAVTGLSPRTTYYFCAVAQSAAGTVFGSLMSFSTLGPPSVVTVAATDVTATVATLKGTVTANGSSGTSYFRYGTTNPGSTCDENFGIRAPATFGTPMTASAVSAPFSQGITGLAGGTTYYFCAAATNSIGTSFGMTQNFRTQQLPDVMTSSASELSGDSPRLNGSGRANGVATTGWFRYGTTNPGSCNDTFGRRAPAMGGTSLGSGSTETPYSQVITNLEPGATYYFCAIASSQVGIAFGQVLSFNANAPVPMVTTERPTDLDKGSATLNGSAKPNGTATQGWFRYAEERPSGCDDVFGTRVPATGGIDLGAGNSPVPFKVSTSLKPGATYYYCAIASNMGGAAFGGVESFTAPAAPPIVRNVEAVVGADGSVALSGAVNPNGSASSAIFRYENTNPLICSGGMGKPAPFGGIALPVGYEDQPVTHTLKGLAPGTYYYCLVANNPAGDGHSELSTFIVKKAATGCTSVDGPALGVVGLLGLALLAFTGRRRGASLRRAP